MEAYVEEGPLESRRQEEPRSGGKPKGQDGGLIEAAAEAFGVNKEEARALGEVDRADLGTELAFSKKGRTDKSPASVAVWSEAHPALFDTEKEVSLTDEMQAALKQVDELIQNQELLNEDGKVSQKTLRELAKTGYWGLLIPQRYGGLEVSFQQFAKLLTEMATKEPSVAGLASVHSCIGAVDPITTFGNTEQKRKYLPLLASGERLSAFALTEKGAGSDLTAVSTTAELKGDYFLVNGEKLFITNANYGSTIGLVCKINGKHGVLIVDLPEKDTENFQIVRYDIHALKKLVNVGLRFKDFKVPKENLLYVETPDGKLHPDKGLVIAYHGLNRGRVALCATAAGAMRKLLANVIPWAHYRVTYTKEIAERELVQQRIGKMTALIAASEALSQWSASLLDKGYRGEAECILAKVFGSEAQKEAAIEYFMKTHGGRSFLKGHLFGDNVHDFLAPCIYEGEGEILSLAFFKAITKKHTEEHFLPLVNKISSLIQEGKIKRFVPANPLHLWRVRQELLNYTGWFVKRALWLGRRKVEGALGIRHKLPKNMDPQFKKHAAFGLSYLEDLSLKISLAMAKYQAKLPERQCKINQISQDAQRAIAMVVTAFWGARQTDPVKQEAALACCERFKRELTGKRINEAESKRLVKLGKAVLSDSSSFTDGIVQEEILQGYK
ncbi:MAG: acyl-CoA dehydrogenase family protein [Candidatus Dadabacteria bacterium]|nr:MAG: acyl-CoA dehydrogenase family protein [Candidatus Dadabacteria bacterium]